MFAVAIDEETLVPLPGTGDDRFSDAMSEPREDAAAEAKAQAAKKVRVVDIV